MDINLDQTPEADALKSVDDDKAVEFMNVASQLERFMKLTPPKEGQKIIYVSGSFDLLHPGHVEFLKQAKALGDYLIVGVEND